MIIQQVIICSRVLFIHSNKVSIPSGIHGIGTVTALEILATFSMATKHSKEACSDQSTTTGTVLSTLYRFRDWFNMHTDLAQPTGSSTRLNLRKKLKNIELNDGFPNPAVRKILNL